MGARERASTKALLLLTFLLGGGDCCLAEGAERSGTDSFETRFSIWNRPISLSVGMSLAEFRVGDWAGGLRDAGYGDTHTGTGSFLGPGGRTQYPTDHGEGNPELYYVDLTVGVRGRQAVALGYATNEPFSEMIGFDASSGSSSTEGSFLYLYPKIRSVSIRWRITGLMGGHGCVGVGPSLHSAELRVFRRDDPSSDSHRARLKETHLGFDLRGRLETGFGSLRIGLDAGYSFVGSLEVGPQETGDPNFPTTGFPFDHAFVGVSVGLAGGEF